MSKNRKDHALWVQVHNIDEDEAIDLKREFSRAKKRVAPEAHGAMFDAPKRELGAKIRKALGMDKNND